MRRFPAIRIRLVQAALDEAPVSEEHAALQAAVKEEFEAYKKTDKTLFDSANWFALQTWNGGDKIGNLDLVKELTACAYPALEWLESMGMEFNDFVTLGGGSLYPRTHGAKTPNGTGYIKAFRNALEGREGVQIMMDNHRRQPDYRWRQGGWRERNRQGRQCCYPDGQQGRYHCDRRLCG